MSQPSQSAARRTDEPDQRPGLRPLKVRDRLPLDPYLVAAIGVEDLDPDHQVDVWTPRLFHERASALFRERVGGWA